MPDIANPLPSGHRVGALKITRIPETEMDGFSLARLFPDLAEHAGSPS
ncbi:hypothetical protein [Frigidibacter sp. ROC022]|nr:hypothetical protein [Frigidibacter sp. ROC022]MCR8726462.1 hypothetical protein [Frigidibacter sp. ROC022]